ncbi:Peptidoglycan glycosyltransferase [Odoribacter splanchnicus DSM 20712]|uniref:Peptidoglycan glycosyltransferase n=1 Tax=Odoribacter splanchnicus (strain ATCC 29572 / DSM 20712 / CIP 104287 / JCM 15291 / NCTC 10825 / 1651/6) TaxID=709991 RepID=F9Z4P9_ODOSD|nr:transglycosylase domain-containing protein [Odoribacter splanchnicus]ADY33734.1 Peptidoglycan glycosyltransferase [Odoribacter splanchnicus DSM 20712]UEB88570.1 transglycosylase domain-containing protein [Odoribacter splanchnicus DSM 20712]SNV41702.1 penicillin-binding protein 1A [Odoribacter splanchnicus]
MFKKYWKFFVIFWSVVLVGIIGVFVFFWLISAGKLGFMPTFEELENPNNRFASEVYFADGPIMNRYFEKENRKYIEYREIPQSVIDALIATEDVRFYDHSGVDVRGLFRVAKGLLTANTSAGGGSTISQQLAKMLFPRESDLNVFELAIRKFREWVIAVRLEKSYTKEEILTMYLNKYDFLNLAVGISSAADIYFQVPLDSLKVEQAAMLIGMAKNSSYYNPVRRPELTLNRRNVVLSQMYKYDKITREECDSLKKLPLGLNFKRVDHKEGLATYFREYLRLFMTANKPDRKRYRDLSQFRLDSVAWKTNPLYGWCKKNVKVDGSHYDLYSDGLKIYTTLDSRMQKYAEEAVREHLSQDLQPLFDKEKVKKHRPPFSNDMTPAEIEEVLDRSIRQSERYRVLSKQGMSFDEIRKTFDQPLEMQVFTWSGIRDTVMTPLDSIKHYKSFFRSGFMVMQPQTGYIKAYVGGPDYRYFMYDMVSAGKRQVGSTIKPILYTLAMQEGLGPCDKVPNIPQTFILPTGEPWSARGGTKRQGEMVTLRWGLANSENNISAWVLKQFTPEAVAQMAHKMGITSFIDPVPSVFLGTAEITVKEMVAAYSIFANKGVYNSPLPVYRIEDKYGNVLQEFRPESREVITENTAYLMCNLLEGVVTGGTGVRLRYKYKLMNPMGGKTGTTQKHADGWFMGVTPDLVGGVWVGAEDRSIHFQNLANGQGASMALPIWAKFLLKAYADPRLKMSDRPFDRPAGINKRLDCDETISEAEVKEMNNGIREDEEEFY